MRRLWLLIIVAMGIHECAQSARARLLEKWSYHRLFKEADLVIIGTARANQRCRDKFSDRHWPVSFTGINTTFRVRQVLKGKFARKRLKVLHFGYGQQPNENANFVQIIDGPGFIKFRTKSIKVEIKGHVVEASIRPDYLLFLKKRADGRFEPISGRIDPELSVRELLENIP